MSNKLIQMCATLLGTRHLVYAYEMNVNVGQTALYYFISFELSFRHTFPVKFWNVTQTSSEINTSIKNKIGLT